MIGFVALQPMKPEAGAHRGATSGATFIALLDVQVADAVRFAG